MSASDLGPEWESIRGQAAEHGLNLAWVLDRSQVDPHFPPDGAPPADPHSPRRGAIPAALLPNYRRAVVLGSGGGRFWERFRAAHPQAPRLEEHPLDRYTEAVAEGLAAEVRRRDPAAVSAFPFDHPRRILPFRGLVQSLAFLGQAPFGVTIDPRHGPWFAWRAVILTRLPYPLSSWDGAAPCLRCPAPCLAACPVGAADRGGFRWQRCLERRLAGRECQTACAAREACPIGEGSRYGREEITYHARSSLRMLRKAASDLEARDAAGRRAEPRGGCSAP